MKYTIKWATGDSDTCSDYRELMVLLGELGYSVDGDSIMDGELVAGRLIRR